MGKRLRTIAKWLFGILATLLGAAVAAGLVMHEPRPESGREGEEADALARRVRAAVGHEAWESGARWIAFDFAGRQRHQWDRERGLAYVTWGDLSSGGGPGETEVWLRLGDRSGVVRVDGERVRGERSEELLDEAWGRHINDTFWLYPFASFFDEGVTRRVLGQDLLIEYASGGATPGDAYLWHLDEQGRPTRWEMWVSVLPIGGVDASWEGWEQEGGVWLATRHELGPLSLELSAIEVRDEPPEPDPFAVLD